MVPQTRALDLWRRLSRSLSPSPCRSVTLSAHIICAGLTVLTASVTAHRAEARPFAPPGMCSNPPPPPFRGDEPVAIGPGILRDPWVPNVPDTPPFVVPPTIPYVPLPLLSTLDSGPARTSTRDRSWAADVIARSSALPVLLQNPFAPTISGYPHEISYEANDSRRAGGNVPDPHGGVGTEYFLEIVNNRITIYDKYTGERYKLPPDSPYPTHDEDLSIFFARDPHGALTDASKRIQEPLTDPRAIKDPLTGRWVASVLGTTVDPMTRIENFYLAVSKTDDARRDWYTFPPFAIQLGPGEKGDFPVLGINPDAILLSVFIGSGTLTSTRVYAFPKMPLFQGSSACVTRFPRANEPALPMFLTPPIVRDSNTKAYFVGPDIRNLPDSSTRLRMYVGQNLGRTDTASLTPLPDIVNAPPYSGPPAGRPFLTASECGNEPLAVLEGRFANAGTQVGRWLWQTHTVTTPTLNGRPRAHFYEIDTSTATSSTPAQLRRYGELYRSSTSNDFNATLVADDEDSVGQGSVAFMTWSSNDPPGACAPEIRYDAVLPTETAATIQQVPGRALPAPFNPNDPNSPFPGPGSIVTTGAWGDYSSVTIDPTPDQSSPIQPPCQHRAWIVNELGAGPAWRTQWAAIGIC